MAYKKSMDERIMAAAFGTVGILLIGFNSSWLVALGVFMLIWGNNI